MVAREVFGQLETTMVVGTGHPAHHSKVHERRDVAIRTRLRHAWVQGDELGDRQGRAAVESASTSSRRAGV